MHTQAVRQPILLYALVTAALALGLYNLLLPAPPRSSNPDRPPVTDYVSGWTRDKDDAVGKPQHPPPKETFLDYYWQGKTIRSAARVDLRGRGSNSQWGFQGTGHFAYCSRLVTDTTVISNDGTKAVFEVKVIESAQLLAVNELDSIRLEPPKESILTDVGKYADKLLLRFPKYTVLRLAIILANELDPGLEASLTTFVNSLKIGDRLVSKGDDMQIVEKLGELQGQHLRIEYVLNRGITNIEVLQGKMLPDQTLQSMAHHGSLLLDYHIFPAMDKEVGKPWTVDPADVAGLFSDGFDTSASGKLHLTRKNDREISGGEKVAVLEISKDSTIDLSYELGGKRKQGMLRPIKDTQIDYSVAGRLVRRAYFDWRASLSTFSTDHLLFDTKELRDVEIKTYYEAEPLDRGAEEKPQKPTGK